MILLLLLCLAFLLWMIQSELYSTGGEVQLQGGACPLCKVETDIDWFICPHCQSRLRKTCDCCHKSKLISQDYCPFCGDAGEKNAA